MTSFLTHRRLVHDRSLPLPRRHAALRTCLTLYAPYGFGSTYHHLTVNARIPRDLSADPESLTRAVDELHEARLLRMAEDARYATQRLREKKAGRREPQQPGTWWHPRKQRTCFQLDPLCHPSLSLPEFVDRQIALAHGTALSADRLRRLRQSPTPSVPFHRPWLHRPLPRLRDSAELLLLRTAPLPATPRTEPVVPPPAQRTHD